MDKRIRIVWIGCHEEGLIAFRDALNAGAEVSAFITLSQASFEKRSAASHAYRDYCQKYAVPYYEVDTIKGDAAYDIVHSIKPELLVVLGWSEILPARLIQIPSIGAIGAHAAMLPHNRGSAPINWALIRGETSAGNTMMWLSAEVDAGEIIDQVPFQITKYDTCKTLYDKVAITNSQMLLKLLKNLRAGVKPVAQIANETDEEILPRRRPKDGLINWRQSCEKVYDFIRALTDPYPGAFTYLNGKKWLVWKAILIPVAHKLAMGEIQGNAYGFTEHGSGLVVGAEDGLILITELSDETGMRYVGAEINKLGLKGVFENE